MKDSLKAFRGKLAEGSQVIGPFMKASDPAFVEIAGYAGFDFAILDMEHGPVGIERMQDLIRGAEVAGLVPIIRVPDSSETSISKALDIGAAGVQVPQVIDAKAARNIVKAAKFHPQGMRGICRFVRAAEYSGMERSRYFSEANKSLVIIQLEGTEALVNLDEILEVSGVDIIFIGPYDLSQSVGHPGEITHPLVLETMTNIITRAKANGIVVGTFVDTREAMERWIKAGVSYISYSVDVGIFSDACRTIRKEFDSLAGASSKFESRDLKGK